MLALEFDRADPAMVYEPMEGRSLAGETAESFDPWQHHGVDVVAPDDDRSESHRSGTERVETIRFVEDHALARLERVTIPQGGTALVWARLGLGLH